MAFLIANPPVVILGFLDERCFLRRELYDRANDILQRVSFFVVPRVHALDVLQNDVLQVLQVDGFSRHVAF